MVSKGLDVLLLLFEEVDEHMAAEAENNCEEKDYPYYRRALLISLISVQCQVLESESLEASRLRKHIDRY